MNKELSIFTTDQLKEELNKRTANETRPLPINKPDFSKLIETTESILEDYATKGYSKGDTEYCYEEAMKCIYGEKVFEWINKYNTGV